MPKAILTFKKALRIPLVQVTFKHIASKKISEFVKEQEEGTTYVDQQNMKLVVLKFLTLILTVNIWR